MRIASGTDRSVAEFLGLSEIRREMGKHSLPENVSRTDLEMYRAVFPLSRKVWKRAFFKVPLAGGLILQLATAQAGLRKLY